MQHTLITSELERVVDNIQGSIPKIEWDFEGIHYFDNGPLTVQYLFVLDALNFCFWPGIFCSFSYQFVYFSLRIFFSSLCYGSLL